MYQTDLWWAFVQTVEKLHLWRTTLHPRSGKLWKVTREKKRAPARVAFTINKIYELFLHPPARQSTNLITHLRTPGRLV
ncbi:hypothetical protein PV327_008389 [Microctonus hyperodae]|uniref:Uncharacterized protein n=1 Tax=Microctonus hyperodae TaxID=165561 RepID=A0AA39KHD6_MICHY|nr:hypothetical protein PV327_008389 [Microctonus hyperodae]